jgi:hypothetical protein
VTAPLPLYKFQQLIKSYDCLIVMKGGSHGKVVKNGIPVSGFAVTHGRHTKGGEVKPIYIRKFLENIERVEHKQ